MDSLKDILTDRVSSLQLNDHENELEQIQHELDRLFEGQALAQRIDSQTNQLFIHVSNGSIATIVRYAQVRILASIRSICDPPIERLVIQIRHPD